MQGTKVLAKQIGKVLMIILKPIIKKYTYKEGNDKMEKLKHGWNVFINFVKANWQTGLGLASFVYVILEACFGFIGNKLASVGVTPEIAYAIISPLYAFIINGLAQKGFEKPDEWQSRIDKEKAQREEHKLIAEAKKLEADKVKEAAAKAKEEAKIQAEAEAKQKAEEHEKLVQQKLIELQLAKQEAENSEQDKQVL